MITNVKKRRRISSILAIFFSMLICMFSMPVMNAFATYESADKKLGIYIYNGGTSNVDPKAQGKSYTKTGGGTIKYTDLVNNDGTLTSNFSYLTSASKDELLTDMLTYANKAVDGDSDDKWKNESDRITDQTYQTWLKGIQNTQGVGTELMTTLLKNTKPDYATANRIYEPFSGVVGTCLALGSILIMAFLGITMVLDLSYIGIPAFRMMVEGGDKGGGKDGKPKFISYEAVNAVQIAEGGQGGGGQNGSEGKVAVGIYFKKRVVMLIILGVCLLYLIQGQIFTLVAWILNLLRGFLGF